MKPPNESNPADELLTDLDDIRTLLDDPAADAEEQATPHGAANLAAAAALAVERTVDITAEARSRSADDSGATAQPTDETFTAAADSDAGVTPAATASAWLDDSILDGETVTEALVRDGLEAAISARIDATLEHWIKETLQIELALLRARLQDAIKSEIENHVSAEIRRTIATRNTHGA